MNLDNVKTLVRSPKNGLLYASEYYWTNPVNGLSTSRIDSTIIEFWLVDSEDMEYLRKLFGDLPEYPDEYMEREK